MRRQRRNARIFGVLVAVVCVGGVAVPTGASAVPTSAMTGARSLTSDLTAHGGLAPVGPAGGASASFTAAGGRHSLVVHLVLKHHSHALAGIAIYLRRGTKPPGTSTTPPSTKPTYRCLLAHCPKPFVHRFSHLRTLHPYTMTAYGFTVGGRYRGLKFPADYPRSTGWLSKGTVSLPHGNTGVHSFVTDAAGKLHGLTRVFCQNRCHPLVNRATYSTRVAGTKTVNAATVSTDYSALTTSPDGNTVYAVGCPFSAVQPAREVVVAVSSDATTLPTPTSADRAVPCSQDVTPPNTKGRALETFNAVGAAGGRVAILQVTNGPSDDGSWQVRSGAPGGAFDTAVLPDVTSVDAHSEQVPQAFIARDQETGDLVVVASASVAGKFGYWAWNGSPDGTQWFTPSYLGQKRDGALIDGVTASDGNVWLGITAVPNDIDNGDSNGPSLPIGVYVQHGIPTHLGGTWDAIMRVPGSGRHANSIQVTSRGGVLRVLFSNHRHKSPLSGSGLRTRTRSADGTWPNRTRAALTHWKGDNALAVLPTRRSYTYVWRRT
jgi:hypothetical protein